MESLAAAVLTEDMTTTPHTLVRTATGKVGSRVLTRLTSLTDGVERALGRAPRDFIDYVRAAAAAGVWRV